MRHYAGLLLGALFALGCKPSIPRSEGWIPLGPGLRLHYLALGSGPDTAIVLHGGPGLHSQYLVQPLESLVPGPE